MIEERRGEDRYPTETFANVEFLVKGRVMQIGHVARALDISLSGAKVEVNMDGPIPTGPGGEVFLTLGLDDALMKARGRIVRAIDTSEIATEVGIEFIDLSVEDMGLIRAFLVAWKTQDETDE